VSRYIDEHRGRFGVEPICTTLDVSAPQAPSERRAPRPAIDGLGGGASPRLATVCEEPVGVPVLSCIRGPMAHVDPARPRINLRDPTCDLRAGGRLTADGEVIQQDGRFVGCRS
jgi:hypothetical protein